MYFEKQNSICLIIMGVLKLVKNIAKGGIRHEKKEEKEK